MFKNAKLACFLNEAEILKFKEFQARREEIVAEFRAVEDKTNAMKKEVAETWEQIRKDYNLNARALQLDRENWTAGRSRRRCCSAPTPEIQTRR